ncbi:MAG: DUF2461 domain-containing protein [Pirellulaceae bacterium]
MSKRAVYSEDCLIFLRELESNNNRQWFADNKQRYEDSVREPSLQLIREIDQRLKKISPFFPGLDRRVGGSLMRIHRDTRFSKEKTPYKTNVGIQFRHEVGKDVHAPGFYVHIEPARCFIGVGCWRPDSQTLHAIRGKIDEAPASWKRARDNKAFRQHFRLDGESLKSAPRDFAKDHPLIEDLRRKDFVGMSDFNDEVVTQNDFVDMIIERFRASKNLMRFLCEAIGVPF